RAEGIYPGTLPLDRVEVLGEKLVSWSSKKHSCLQAKEGSIWIKASTKGVVYVDDIIFGSTHPRYTQLFSDLMKSHFKMSMMGEMTFFLGLQVNQSPCGIFINQSKYVLEILKNMEWNLVTPLAKPTEKHIKEVKRIFRYLRGTVNTGLWYTKDSGFELTGFSDADYAGCKDSFKSTSGGAQFLGEKLVRWSSKKQDCTALSTAKAELYDVLDSKFRLVLAKP
nr:uncharacterized mitochondrial protein AtMg00810-like [Tanacetum cinerariifolium]